MLTPSPAVIIWYSCVEGKKFSSERVVIRLWRGSHEMSCEIIPCKMLLLFVLLMALFFLVITREAPSLQFLTTTVLGQLARKYIVCLYLFSMKVMD